jgi:septum formation protein
MPKIILATTSPYRIEALRFLGIDFEAEGSKIDESQTERNDPEELVKTLSRLKAEAVAKNYSDAIVIGMDSIGYSNGKILEKPKSKEEGYERLKALSGNNFQFLTGIWAVNTASHKTVSRVVKTDAVMRDLTDVEINRYLDEDPRFNTYAMGFDQMGHTSASFIQEIKGSYNNSLRGIPLESMREILLEVGYKL